MKVQITRRMTVANAQGYSETFDPTGPGEFREDIDADTVERLRRAGAVAVFPDESEGDSSNHPNMTTDAETATANDSTNGVYDPLSREAADLRGQTVVEGENGGSDDDSQETAEDLMKLNKDELVGIAEDEGVDFAPTANKQAIADAIIAKRKAEAA